MIFIKFFFCFAKCYFVIYNLRKDLSTESLIRTQKINEDYNESHYFFVLIQMFFTSPLISLDFFS